MIHERHMNALSTAVTLNCVALVFMVTAMAFGPVFGGVGAATFIIAVYVIAFIATA